MLRKIFKYDFISIMKFLLIFYGLSLFFGLLTRLFFSFNNSLFLNIIAQIFNGASISMMCSIVINNLMRVWVKFSQSFYKDESYLIHTLPISKKDLYLSKILTGFISLFISFIVIVANCLIMYGTKENFNFLKEVVFINQNVTLLLITLIGVIFLELINLVQSGFTGLLIGNRKNNYKIGLSILFGGISYFVLQIIVLLIYLFVGVFDNRIYDVLLSSNEDFELIKVIINYGLVIYLIPFVLNIILNIKIFNKGVDVE